MHAQTPHHEHAHPGAWGVPAPCMAHHEGSTPSTAPQPTPGTRGQDSTMTDLPDGDREEGTNLQEELAELKEDMGGVVSLVRQQAQRIDELEDRLDDVEAENQRLRDENQALREEVAEVDERTDLLQAIKQGAALSSEEKVAYLVQTLVQEAQSRPDSDPKRATMTAREGKKVLGGEVHRTTLYDLLPKAAEMVGNEDVCWFQERSGKSNRLIVDLEAGEMPRTIAGHEIHTESRGVESPQHEKAGGVPQPGD